MPSSTLTPAALVSPVGAWTLTGAASAEAALSSNDAGASVVTTNPTAGQLVLAMQDLPAVAAVVSSAQVRVTYASALGLQAKFKLGATLGLLSAQAMDIHAVTGGFVTTTATLPRPGGGVWSLADLSNASCYIAPSGTPGSLVVSFVAWDVVYALTSSIGANRSGQGIDRAYLTARCGWARCDASRMGFAPTATQGTTAAAGLAPGSPGGYYSWRRRYLPATVWTPVRPPAAQR